MALRLERKTLIHEVVGSRPASGVSAPQIRGLDDSATGIGQANRFQLVRLAPEEVPNYSLGVLLVLVLEKCSVHVLPIWDD